ncbi:hypothetical protein SAMN05444161_3105 [Rhizobiales bacterium GAS191]|nr:hypothetical protein SAMN05444161_3105 [Rhizobiales bacterium GAS191]
MPKLKQPIPKRVHGAPISPKTAAARRNAKRRREMALPPNWRERGGLLIDEACAVLAISNSKAHQLMLDGRLTRIKVDNRTLVGVPSILALLGEV